MSWSHFHFEASCRMDKAGEPDTNMAPKGTIFLPLPSGNLASKMEIYYSYYS